MNDQEMRANETPKTVLVFLLLLAVYAYFFPRWADWNQNSRFDTVLAVVDKGTFAIDDYYQNTGDYATYNGHYYSDKAPGTSLLGIPIYWAFRTMVDPFLSQFLSHLASNQVWVATLNPVGTGLIGDKINFFVGLTFVTFFVVAIPAASLGVLLYKFLGEIVTRPHVRLLTVLGFAFATPMLAYGNLFVSHAITAFCLFAAFYLLRHAARVRPLNLMLAGLLSGLAVIMEYPAALIAGALLVYGFSLLTTRHHVIWFIAGAMLSALLLAAYNIRVWESPIAVGYAKSALFPEHFQTGFLGITYPRIEALWGLTFSPYRGLFFLSPFLLLAFPGLALLWKRKDWRKESAVILWSIISVLLLTSAIPEWDGGFAIGPRYLLILLPFLSLPVALLADHYWDRLYFRVAFSALCAWSILAVGLESIGGQSFPQVASNPLFDYSIPRVLSGDIARNWGMVLGLSGIASLVPLVGLSAAFIFILLKERRVHA